MLLNLDERTLSNRQRAASEAGEILAKQSGSDCSIVVSLEGAIATTSWLSGFIGSIADAGTYFLVFVTSEDDTIEHLRLALKGTNRAVFHAFNMEALSSGHLHAIGDITEAEAETFSLISQSGEASVELVASALGLTIPAAQQRLNGLVAKAVIVRERYGRAYSYRLPSIGSRTLSAVS